MKNLKLVLFGLVFLHIGGLVYANAQGIEKPAANNMPPVIQAVKVDKAPKIDGQLDDPCWQIASKVTGFYRIDKEKPATEETVARICYDSKNIYVAFHCLDSQPDKIRAQERKRGGNLGEDDLVGVVLDVYHQHRQTYTFLVNPRGTQAQETPGGTATKIEWMGDWTAAAKIVSDGWQAELAIPFAILKYPKDAHTFGLFFFRHLAREREDSGFPNMGGAPDLRKMADWTGLITPEPKVKPLFLAYTMTRNIMTESPQGFPTFPAKESSLVSGLDVKHALTDQLTGLLTVNPDFENVEQEVETIDFSYTERFLPDRRPFFQEGESFMPPQDMFYSRRIDKIDFGTKLVGKTGKYGLGFMHASDFGHRADTAFRVNYDIGEVSGATAALVRTNKLNRDNLVAFGALNLGTRRGRRWTYFNPGFFQSYNNGEKLGKEIATSFSTQGGSGDLNFNLSYLDRDPDYEPDDGFVPDKDMKGFYSELSTSNRFDKGKLQFIFWQLNGSLFHRHNGKFFQKHFFSGAGARFREGSFYFIGFSQAQRENYQDQTTSFNIGWNQNDLYRGGNLSFNWGKRANADYLFVSLGQGFKVSKDITFRLSNEYRKMVFPGMLEDITTQLIFTANYDISDERGFGMRLIRRTDRTGEAKLNLSLTYRQAVRRGLDAYFIFGDPNAPKTVMRLAGKLIFPL